MYKTDIFETILKTVSKETGISAEQIISSCKMVEVVDARYILVNLLYWAGLYPSVISSLIGITTRSVNLILTNFETRKSYGKTLGINYENIKKQLGNNITHF